MLLLVTAHGRYGAHLNRVQHRWDRANIILAQKQTEQSCEMFPFPLGFPEHVIQLLQG